MSAELYHTELVARARQAFGEGRLPAAAASITLDNPLCGDRVTLDLETGDGTVTAIGHEVKGCLLCAASAATIAEFGRDRSPAELREMDAAARALMKDGTPVPEKFAALRVFSPVHASKSRRDCVLLPFEALGKALDAAF
ncbi:iron-sulfur cluster assembly scaffold protein [Dongia sedimenti]|uniref:Iron-sulfur cluster assembly scaffold protein n=1 Tax=Dongia sedimenti TaxID=3064282 RepID=A0ABU0YI62_9PROT|nr:iron-sulfur cluster assembly scaffold protein [Rhodospirillaceae bacterium R-7]